jgi:hypothetical protein
VLTAELLFLLYLRVVAWRSYLVPVTMPASVGGRVDSYFVCGTPRTGSSLLLGLLESTGVAGHPQAYFREPDEPAWAGLEMPGERVLLPRHERQTDELSGRWIGRYRLETAQLRVIKAVASALGAVAIPAWPGLPTMSSEIIRKVILLGKADV